MTVNVAEKRRCGKEAQSDIRTEGRKVRQRLNMLEKRVCNLKLTAQIPFCFVKHAVVESQELLRSILLEGVELIKQFRYQHFHGNHVIVPLIGEKFSQLAPVVFSLII